MPHRVLVGFTQGERKRLQTYLEDENVELDHFDVHGDLAKIKRHKYYAEMDNYYIEHPRTNPVNMSIGNLFLHFFKLMSYLVIKNNGRPWKDHVDEIIKCFKLPLEIKIDFYCLTESLTR